MKTKRKLVETLLLPLALYGTETWTLKATDSFKMWVWRKLFPLDCSRNHYHQY